MRALERARRNQKEKEEALQEMWAQFESKRWAAEETRLSTVSSKQESRDKMWNHIEAGELLLTQLREGDKQEIQRMAERFESWDEEMQRQYAMQQLKQEEERR